jgi:hypothetical protein
MVLLLLVGKGGKGLVRGYDGEELEVKRIKLSRLHNANLLTRTSILRQYVCELTRHVVRNDLALGV